MTPSVAASCDTSLSDATAHKICYRAVPVSSYGLLRVCHHIVSCHVIFCLYKKDKEFIEKIRHRFTKMIKIWRVILGLCTFKERRNRHDLIELFKISRGLSRVRIDELFMF